MSTEDTFADRCRAVLNEQWALVQRRCEQEPGCEWTPAEDMRSAIRRAVNSNTKSYRYVLPTQVLAKHADSTLDCRCLQSSRGGEGAFDARTIAHAVLVPFDRDHDSVLGGSPEPYVNNPLRVGEITAAHRDAQKNKTGWDDLCTILAQVEEVDDTDFTLGVLRQVLKEVHARLATIRVVYPVPNRISLQRCLEHMAAFTRASSGGDRFQAVTAALFLVVGRRFGLFEEIRRGGTNAADAASGTLADIECRRSDGGIVMIVEAKDRHLTIRQVQDKIPGLRETGVAEAFFVAAQGAEPADAAALEHFVEQQFAAGQNIYVTDLLSLAKTLLATIGEAGRRRFLEAVGDQLNEYSDHAHRRAWADLLGKT